METNRPLTPQEQATLEALAEWGGQVYIDELEVFVPDPDSLFMDYVELPELQKVLQSLRSKGLVKGEWGKPWSLA